MSGRSSPAAPWSLSSLGKCPHHPVSEAFSTWRSSAFLAFQGFSPRGASFPRASCGRIGKPPAQVVSELSNASPPRGLQSLPPSPCGFGHAAGTLHRRICFPAMGQARNVHGEMAPMTAVPGRPIQMGSGAGGTGRPRASCTTCRLAQGLGAVAPRLILRPVYLPPGPCWPVAAARAQGTTGV